MLRPLGVAGSAFARLFSEHGCSVSLITRFLTIALTEPGHAWDQMKKLMSTTRPTQPVAHHAPSTDWQARLHEALGAEYPCQLGGEFEELWERLNRELRSRGRVGEELDADPALARCLWCVVRHVQPRAVVETGVARGISSRMILEGLSRQGSGHLWSVDLPSLRDPWWSQAASAVPAIARDRWTYFRGDSMRLLPRMLNQARPIDVFVHDSVHDENYMTFEIEHALEAMRPGGVLLVDDVGESDSFGRVAAQGNLRQWWICRHESKTGAFAVAVKR